MIVMRSKTGLEMKLNHSDAAMMATASPRMGPSHLMTDHKNDKYKNVMDRLSKNQPPSKAAEERKDYKDTHRGNERRQYGWSEGLNINNPEHPYSRYGDIEKVSDGFPGRGWHHGQRKIGAERYKRVTGAYSLVIIVVTSGENP
jgi:hypothetical protein